MKQEDIEIQIWAYIDGSCSELEKADVAKHIATDEQWANCYAEALSMHQSLTNSLEAEAAPVQLVNNVMQHVAPQTTSSKTLVFKWGIRAVAAFFLILIPVLLIYTIAQTDFSFTDRVNLIPESNGFTLSEKAMSILKMLAGFVLLVALLISSDHILRSKSKPTSL